MDVLHVRGMPEFHEKQCKGTCGLWLDPSCFGRNSCAKDGLQTRCRTCQAERNRAKYRNSAEHVPSKDEWWCYRCKLRLPAEDFSPSNLRPSGKCRRCVKADGAAYYQSRRDRILSRTKLYTESHKEQKRAADAARYQRRKEECREYQKRCRESNRSALNEKARVRRPSNLEKARQRDAEYYARNKDVIRGRVRKNIEQIRARRRKNYLKRKYGMSLSDYTNMLIIQDGRCAICKENDPGAARNGRDCFAVDHNHATGARRGLLCDDCNKLLGFAKDNPSICRGAADYLDLHASQAGSPVQAHLCVPA